MVLDLLELELRVVVSHLPWVLGTDLLSSETVTQAPNHCSVSLQCYDCSLSITLATFKFINNMYVCLYP